MPEVALQEVNSFEHDDIEVMKFVEMFAKSCCGLFRIVCLEFHTAVVAERNDQLGEHFLKTDRVEVEMLCGTRFVEADMRQIQPAVDVDSRSIESRR